MHAFWRHVLHQSTLCLLRKEEEKRTNPTNSLIGRRHFCLILDKSILNMNVMGHLSSYSSYFVFLLDLTNKKDK